MVMVLASRVPWAENRDWLARSSWVPAQTQRLFAKGSLRVPPRPFGSSKQPSLSASGGLFWVKVCAECASAGAHQTMRDPPRPSVTTRVAEAPRATLCSGSDGPNRPTDLADSGRGVPTAAHE